MIINEKIVVKNYKCFDGNGVGFERVLPINVIIGKNNSGKSSLLDLVQFYTKANIEFVNTKRDDAISEVIITHNLTEKEIGAVFKSNVGGGNIPGKNHFEYGKLFINKPYSFKIESDGKKNFVSIGEDFLPHATHLIHALGNVIKNPFTNKLYCNITAERDITPEVSNSDIYLKNNGVGATNYVQQIINSTGRDSKLIELELLNELNNIVNPDIIFTRILVQLNIVDLRWEIFFEDANKKRIALSKMGSGIKTILLVLLNLIVRPSIEGKKQDSYIFAFEELENNLHPSLQRRLYAYIKGYSEKHAAYFFLTTHSNIVIDSFGTYEKSQLLHIMNDGDKSTVKTVLSHLEHKQILKDLDIKASDLLQSNGIIWVEGPSDRNYLNKWLELLSPELKEGLHYSIMFYGGKLLSNLTFDFDWFNHDVIPLIKINRNAFVIIDRDGKNLNAKLNKTKERINKEIGNDCCWITKGREIENYLSDICINDWLLKIHNYSGRIDNNKDTKLEENIFNSYKNCKLIYNKNKTEFSAEITPFIKVDSLNTLDLKVNLVRLINNIKEWNSIK